jgi:energy-coupling factor transporter ATP-binding protein EcfA2
VEPVIRTEAIKKDYELGAEVVHAVRGVDLVIERGEFVAIMGPSGSGKSTFMNLLGCLDTPTEGKYWLNGALVSELSDDELARVRNREIGRGPTRSTTSSCRSSTRASRPRIGDGGRRRSSRWSGSRTGWGIVPRSSRAGSASGSRSRARS